VTDHLRGLAGRAAGDEAPLLDAATVVLLRDRPDGFECLMLRKTEAQAFGGLWVFPGGRVEERDGTGLEGARQAAVREAAEETGLPLVAEDLVPVAHWTPPPSAPRRYRTWFFVAAMPPGALEVVVDGGEIGDHVWVRPADALDQHRQGQIELLPPTWVTLRRLAPRASVAEALADAAASPVDRFVTDVRVDQDGTVVTVWDGDAAYSLTPSGQSGPGERTDLDTPGPRHRLIMDPAGWRYERS